MRVAFVAATTRHHAAADPDRAARVDGVAEQLAGRGHDVTILTTRFWGGDRATTSKSGVTYRALADGFGTEFAVRVPWTLHELDPDVTHVVHDDPSVVVAAEFGGAPVVVDWYDLPTDAATGVWGRVQDWLRRRAARGPSVVVTPSTLVKTSVRELGRPASAIEVIPTGIEFELIRSVDPIDRGEIVYARYLDDAANLEDLFLALAEFRRLDWQAVVIGDGPARSRYEQQAEELRIDDRVTFTGDLPIDARLAMFKGASAYVHTARRSSFPTDLVRAMACGCVGIVSYHAESSAHEFVDADDRGFLTTSPEEIAGALQDAANLEHRTFDPGFESYSQDTVLDRYLEVYRSVIESGDFR